MSGSRAPDPPRGSLGPFIVKSQDMEKLKVLGKGSFGVVYDGRLKIAAKTSHVLLNPATSDLDARHPEYKKMLSDFIAEASMLVTLRHVNVIRVYGVSADDDGVPWMLLELADMPLDQYLFKTKRASGMSVEELVVMWFQIACGLKYLHGHKPLPVIHRDIKPDNIMVVIRRDGSVQYKIADVGLARMTNAAGTLDTTTTGGCLHYLAPEIPTGDGFTGKADVYSLGIAICETSLVYLNAPAAERCSMADVEKDWRNIIVKGVAWMGLSSAPLSSLLAFSCVAEPEKRLTSSRLVESLLELYPDLLGPLLPAPDDNTVAARAEAYLSSVEAELADLKQKFREHTCFSRCLWEQTPASPSKPPLMSRSMPALSSPLSPRRVSLVSRGGIPVTGRSSVTIPLSPTSVNILRVGTPLTGYSSINGTHVRSLTVKSNYHRGLAISPDGSLMAVADAAVHSIAVYNVSHGARQAEFGSYGSGPGQFNYPRKLCFSPRTGNILVADSDNQRVQEMTVSGSHVRMIGAGLIEAMAYCIAASVEMIAVGTWSDMKPVLIFDVLSGGLIRVFGVKGPAVGQLSGPSGIRFTPDGEHLLISEHSNDRLSLFTLTGKFVACGGVGTLNRPSDVDFASNGDILVADWFRHRVCVFSPDGGDLLRTFGSEEETSTVNFKYPTALAMHGGQLFLLDGESEQVQVFD